MGGATRPCKKKHDCAATQPIPNDRCLGETNETLSRDARGVVRRALDIEERVCVFTDNSTFRPRCDQDRDWVVQLIDWMQCQEDYCYEIG